MGARQRVWARQKRALLVERLGGRCVSCGATSELEFDHINPGSREYVARHREWSWRISTVSREVKAGLIQLLCSECNKRKGSKELPKSEPPLDTEAPF